MSLWCVVSISEGVCVPISAAGAQWPHTLSLGLRGGFCGASVFHGTLHTQTLHLRHEPFVHGFVVTERVF